jgi:hypothetical protein
VVMMLTNEERKTKNEERERLNEERGTGSRGVDDVLV